MKYQYFILIISAVLTSCVDTHKDIFTSEVSVESLKTILENQTCHNKAVFIFDPACPTCMFYLQDEYPIMQERFLDSIDYIFIAVDTIPLDQYKIFFHAIGIKTGHLLSLQEKNPVYLQSNGNIDISTIIKYLFTNGEDMRIIGFPLSALASKANRLKLEYHFMNDSVSIIRPKPWHKLYSPGLNEIDFSAIDNYTD